MDAFVSVQFERIEELPVYFVKFVDWDGSVIKVTTVEQGKTAKAPDVEREGYKFAGWDNSIISVKSDMTVKARYTVKTFTVKYYYDGALLWEDLVEYGKAATESDEYSGQLENLLVKLEQSGYEFLGWDQDLSVVEGNMEVNVVYTKLSGPTAVKEKRIEKSESWYEMSGRKLVGKPTRKGVYVHNGKLEMVK
jgi:hypothetical protein